MGVVSPRRPTAQTESECERAVAVRVRPMWPVAPKMSQTLGMGGLVADGGLVVWGRDRLGALRV